MKLIGKKVLLVAGAVAVGAAMVALTLTNVGTGLGQPTDVPPAEVAEPAIPADPGPPGGGAQPAQAAQPAVPPTAPPASLPSAGNGPTIGGATGLGLVTLLALAGLALTSVAGVSLARESRRSK